MANQTIQTRPAMRTRRFGKTGLEMPVFSCGGMRYQASWNGDTPESDIPADNQANLEATIRRSLELGINHIETARGYGTSELQLGRVLPHLPRDAMIVQTKVGPEDSADAFRKVLDKSLALLHLDRVDLLSVHGINDESDFDKTFRKGGSLEALLKARDEGLTRFVGFSTHAHPDLILRAIQTGAFDYINLHWYFVNTFAEPCLHAAAQRDMGVFIISPTDKGGRFQEPPQKMVDLCAPLHPIQFNDLWCLARPEIHTLSVGAAKPTDFDLHVDALAYCDRIDEVVRPIEARLHAQLEQCHGADWMAAWHRHLPHHHDAPGNINVHEILRLWTYAKALDLVGWAKMRYNLLGNAGSWFPGQNASKIDEFADALAAPLSQNPFAPRIPDILREAHNMLFEAAKKRLSQE